MKRSFWMIGLLPIFLAISTWQVYAQQPTPSDDQVNAIASQLFCPVCENIPLDVCPTQACHQWRELIRQMLAEGKSEAAIKQYFVDHYGARVLSEPPATGLNWLVYIVPPAAFLVGIFLLYLAFRTWKQTRLNSSMDNIPLQSGRKTSVQPGPSSKTTIPSEADDDYIARLEEELRKQN
jgi:cytochrome c-type biogenesis protein CcmH